MALLVLELIFLGLAFAALTFMAWLTVRLLFFRRPVPAVFLERHEKNPILSPVGEHPWEWDATFNPAIAYDEDTGLVHLFYRALGADGISRLGYARSQDGVHFERLPYPVYTHTHAQAPDPLKVMARNKNVHFSGGGWGGWSGSEDPRAVIIDGTLYLTYTAFEGWHAIRVTMTSLPLPFLNRRVWEFSEPIFLSPDGQVHKNWVLFPEKINGSFALITSVTPKVQVEYYRNEDELPARAQQVESIFAQENRQGKKARERWESSVRGAGPPPLKTPRGWLLFYHAVDSRDAGKYKLGAMLLNLHDPTKVLYRSRYPVLEPSAHYENNGKPGVVYACGAFIKDGSLFLYYGGADRVSCVATAPLEDFLQALMHAKHPIFTKRKVRA